MNTLFPLSPLPYVLWLLVLTLWFGYTNPSYANSEDTTKSPPKPQQKPHHEETSFHGVIKSVSTGNISTAMLFTQTHQAHQAHKLGPSMIPSCNRGKELFAYLNFEVRIHGKMQRTSLQPSLQRKCLQIQNITFLKTPQNRKAIAANIVKHKDHFLLKSLLQTDKTYPLYKLSPAMQYYFKSKTPLIVSLLRDIKDEKYYKVQELYNYPQWNKWK